MTHRHRHPGLIGLIACVLTLGATAFAEEEVDVTIYLKDGTEVRGQLLDYASLRYRVQVDGEVKVLRADQVAFMEFGELSASGEFPAETINLDVDGVAIRDVMDQIGHQVGHTILVAPGLDAKVTVSLRDLPWRDAVGVIAAMVEAEVVDEGDHLLLRARSGLKTARIGAEEFAHHAVFLDLSAGAVTTLAGSQVGPLQADLYIDRLQLEVVGLLTGDGELSQTGFPTLIALTPGADFEDPDSFPAKPEWRGVEPGHLRGLPSPQIKGGTVFLARDRFGVVHRVLIDAFDRDAGEIRLSWAPLNEAQGLDPERTALMSLQGDPSMVASSVLVGDPGSSGGVEWSTVSAVEAARMLASRQQVDPTRARAQVTQVQAASLPEAFPGVAPPDSLKHGAWRVDFSNQGFRQTVFMTPEREVVAIVLSADTNVRETGALQLLDSARQMVRKQAWGRALEHFERAIKFDPNLVEAHHERGMILAQLGRHAEAKQAYTRALELDPKNVHVHVLRGVSREEVGEIQGAIADYTRCGELMPSYAPAFYNRALAKKSLDDHLGALADLDQAIGLDSNYGLAYAARASVRRILNDPQGSIEDCDQSLRVDPTYVRAWVRRALAKRDLGDMQGAFADLDEALRLEPRSHLALRNRAQLRERVGDAAGAVADYEKALEVMPSGHSQAESVREALKRLRGR